MILIITNLTDPRFNLATEEYLLKESNKDFFLLNINEPSVIIGKHQNALAEVNLRFITENNIKIIRRISGGGTVFHDEGNLNFSFITNGKEGHLIDFKKYTSPIIEILGKLRIEAKLEGKNDLRVNGLKISGNAEHVYKNRILHHGTILVSANMQKLSSSLHISENKYFDNAVKSIRSKITNLCSLTKPNLSIEVLKSEIIKYFLETQQGKLYELSSSEIERIKSLVQNKYSSWEWNFGYSPKYKFENSFSLKGSEIKISLEVENGIIMNSQIDSYSDFDRQIINRRHNYDEIKQVLSNQPQFKDEDASEIAWSFF